MKDYNVHHLIFAAATIASISSFVGKLTLLPLCGSIFLVSLNDAAASATFDTSASVGMWPFDGSCANASTALVDLSMAYSKKRTDEPLKTYPAFECACLLLCEAPTRRIRAAVTTVP